MLSDLWVVQIIMFLTGRFFATYAMNVGFQFSVEVMPTCIRGQGIALVNVMSMVSQMTSPYIVYSVGQGNLNIFSKAKMFYIPVCSVRKGTLLDNSISEYSWCHSGSVSTRNCWQKDAGDFRGHEGVWMSWQVLLDANLQIQKKVQENWV